MADLREAATRPAPSDGVRTSVRHHQHLLPETIERLFLRSPGALSTRRREDVGAALGASLYMPALLDDLASRIAGLASRFGVTSVVVCLEDSVPDGLLPEAELNLINQAAMLGDVASVLVFVRPRTPEHLAGLVERLGQRLHHLAGFALPKFAASNAGAWFAAVGEARAVNPSLLAMPILEGPEVLFIESRQRELMHLSVQLEQFAEMIAAIRIGTTDLSGLLGIRRSRTSSVYDIPSVASAVGDIVNVWCRPSSSHIVAGSVWEYYRNTSDGVDPGLLREAQRDLECGMLGKSVIHPGHVRVVNSLLTVSAEDFADASDVLRSHGGVSASAHHVRMNEANPHRNWARRIMQRADVFGVLREGVGFLDLVAAV